MTTHLISVRTGDYRACVELQIANAKETESKIDEELKDLQATLSNIEDARPFDELTVNLFSPISVMMAC